MKNWCFLIPHHLADHWWTLGVSHSPCHVVRDGNSANLGGNSANWGGGAWLGYFYVNAAIMGWLLLAVQL